MSAIKITQLPHYTIINANTSNTLFLGVDLPTDVTYTFTAHTLAQGLYSNEILNVGSNAVLFSNTIAQFSGSDPMFLQVNQQNFNANGTSDYVLTADTGTNAGGYIDLGINNSQWNPVTADQTSQYPFDGYLIVEGPGSTPTGNLVLGTSNPSTNVVFAVGGYYANNVVGWMSNTGTVLTRTTTFNAEVVLNPQNIVPPNGLPQSPVLNIVQSANSTVPVFNVNANTGNQSESDFVVLNDQYASQSIYGDFGINSSTYVGTGTGLPFNDANGTYLFSSGGTLSVGTLGANDFKLITNTTYRLNVNGASGIITVNGTTPATSITTGAVVISGGLGVAGNVYSGGHYITGTGNGITFVDGTLQTTNAAPFGYTQSAFNKANSAVQNTAVVQLQSLTLTGNLIANSVGQGIFVDKFTSNSATFSQNMIVSGNLTANTLLGNIFFSNVVTTTTQSNSIIWFPQSYSITQQTGQLWYYSNTQSLILDTDIAGDRLSISKVLFFRAYNSTGATIPANSFVRLITGVTANQIPYIALADATSSANATVAGLVKNSIANGAYGFAYSQGIVEDLNSTGLGQNGDILFLSTTPGIASNTAPSGNSNTVVQLGRVILSDATQGKLFIQNQLRQAYGRTNGSVLYAYANNIVSSNTLSINDATGYMNANNIVANSITVINETITGTVNANTLIANTFVYGSATANSGVTQLTSRTTSVTANGISGTIIGYSGSALVHQTGYVFTIYNSSVLHTTDIVMVSVQNSNCPLPHVTVANTRVGSFDVAVFNGAGAGNDAAYTMNINFGIIRVGS